MTDFDLRKFVHKVHENSVITGPKSLAKEVLAQLDPGDVHAALEQAMPLYAQNFLSSLRGSLYPLPGQALPDTQVVGAGQGPNIAKKTSDSAHSWKTRASRARWRARLEELHCGGPDQTWLAFGDCDIAALTRIADYADKLAAANQRTAEKMRTGIALLKQHNVATIRDLPEHTLRLYITGEAAA